MNKNKILSSFVLILFLSGCAGLFPAQPTVQPTIALPSDTPTPKRLPPTYTPTYTPIPPTATNTPIPPTATPTRTQTPTRTPTQAPVTLLGAGNIAVCGDLNQGDERTSRLVEKFPGAAIFTTGDNVYGAGTPNDFAFCYDPTWGRFKGRTRPSPGDHDYWTEKGKAYYTYFGANAGAAEIGFYSYNLGEWHIVALNSNCNDVGCKTDSAQADWLRDDLANHPQMCTLIYWHNPRWSSGDAGDTKTVDPFWTIAAEMQADVVVNGHDHDYERFVPMDAKGQPDTKGVREFIVGTGGAVMRNFGAVKATSELRYNSTNGIIVFTLYADHYDWEFVPTSGKFQDSGSGDCH
jgi:acid phosphatase type 7